MKYLLDVKLVVLLIAGLMSCGIITVQNKKAYATAGDVKPGFLATYSSSKSATCVRGSLAHSKTRIFNCWSTGKWKAVTIN